MSRICLTVLTLLAAGFAAVATDGARQTPDRRLAAVVAVTRLPGPALGVHYFEARCRPYADYSPAVHPDLTPPAMMDFVYEP